MKGAPAPGCAAIILVTMDDFAGIPPLGDTFAYASDEETKSVSDEEEAGEEAGDGKYHINGKHIYVTWSKSKIDSKEEFHEKLLAMLPAGVRMFGGRELHEDGRRIIMWCFLSRIGYTGETQQRSFGLKEILMRFDLRSRSPGSA